MVGLFSRRRRKESAETTSSAPATPVKSQSINKKGGHAHLPAPVDELGRTLHSHASAPPAFTVGSSQQRRHSSSDLPSPTYASSPYASSPVGEELQLAYGYWIIETQRELDATQVNEIVSLCSKQIKARGLQYPLLFSTKALDISLESTCALIRTYLYQRPNFAIDVQHASPHDLAAVIKWALGRLTNNQGSHGFVHYDNYDSWRSAERAAKLVPTSDLTSLVLTAVSAIQSTS